ncbi:MAG: hypothetical protein RLY20_2649 [Verrucomicrobiota bacterium]|jgi:hypothetical protein
MIWLNFSRRGHRFALVAALVALTGCVTVEPPKTGGVVLATPPGKVVVSLNGQPFTEYCYLNTSKPYLFPLLGPANANMTRSFPLADVAGEEHDHPHHRSVWFGHGLVNGQDFWTEKKGSGRIVHDKFNAIRGGPERGYFSTHNRWVDANGKPVCSDDRRLTFYNRNGSERMMDLEITLNADHGELVLGDTKEGTMAIRVAETMRLTQPTGTANPQSRIVNSEGAHDTEAWGKRAKWCDYTGLVGGKLMGVTLFDHPENPRVPTWWMVRDYGLLAANPFGQHEFEKLSNENVGDLKIPAGQSVTFRYRILIHAGSADDTKLRECYEDFARPIQK